MFVAAFRYDYHVVRPAKVMRFASVSNHDEYRELQQTDAAMTEVWYFQPKAGLDGASPDAFQLIEVIVDGTQQKIRRTSKAGTQLYSVYLEDAEQESNDAVAVSFTYRGLVQQHGHLLNIDLTKPTKGLTVQLAYGGAGIRKVSVSDHIAAAKQPVVSRVSADGPSPSVSLTFEGWVMPRAGVEFVWVLNTEMPSS
jgi:hypothetical protein